MKNTSSTESRLHTGRSDCVQPPGDATADDNALDIKPECTCEFYQLTEGSAEIIPLHRCSNHGTDGQRTNSESQSRQGTSARSGQSDANTQGIYYMEWDIHQNSTKIQHRC